MNRKEKIDLLKGILKGTRSPAELRPRRFAIAYQNPDTGQFSPYRKFGQSPEQAERNARLLEKSKTDASITVIRIVYD